jgi:hypothetical protein
LTDGSHPQWRRGIEPISLDNLNRLGIDSEHQLYWDGNPIEVRRSIVLTRLQKRIAVIATIVGLFAGIATIATGINNASIFLCARHISWLSCPKP